MSRLKFTPNPTFKIDVNVPVAGQDEPGILTITFKHLKPIEWQAIFSDAQAKLSASVETADHLAQRDVMVESLLKIMHAWAWDDIPMTEENIALAIENYPAFYASVMQAYGEELWKVRAKS